MEDSGPHQESFAEVFRAALAAKSLTLTELRARLLKQEIAVSMSTLSYWRSAARRPDAVAQQETIAQVEELLDLRPGRLGSLAARKHRLPAHRVPDLRFPAGESGDDPAQWFAEMDRALDASPNEWFREVSLQQTFDIGVEGYPVRATVQFVMECVENRLSRISFGMASPGGYADLITFTVLAGGRVTDHYLNPDRTMHGVLIELDAPLEVGDTALLMIRLDFTEGMPSERGASVGVNRTATKLVSWVRFHPDAVPDWFEEVEATPEGERRRYRGLDTPTSIHQARWNWGPGSLNLTWGYGTPPAR